MAVDYQGTRRRESSNEWLVLFFAPASFGLVGFLLFWTTPYLEIGSDAAAYRVPFLYGSLVAFGIALSWATWSLYRLWRNGRLPTYLVVLTVTLTAVLGHVFGYWP